MAAVGRNGAIGVDNRLPWRMPSDLARFRERTIGRPMIMGRKTFESIGRVLPGRDSIVVMRDALPAAPDLYAVRDLDTALATGALRAAARGVDEIAVIGGASVFSAMMPLADRLAITIVDLAPDADRFFPAIDPRLWREVAREAPPRRSDDDASCIFVDYVRR